MFRKMPFILLGILFFLIVGNKLIPLKVQEILYALSLTIISVLISILPIIIFILLFKVAARLAKKATILIIFIFGSACLSNFIGTMLSYGIGKFVYQFDLQIQLPQSVQPLTGAWQLTMPKFISNDLAMLAGLIIGILCSTLRPAPTIKIANYLDRLVTKIFVGIVCIMPLFFAGFAIKLIHDEIIYTIIIQYSGIFLSIAAALILYISLLYLIYNKFNFYNYIKCIKNMSGAALTGMGTMSSAAAMPLTIIGTEKNSRHPSIVHAIIPATVNIHLVGDCFGIPVFAFAILKTFGLPEPTILQYVIFAVFFVIAKFSAAGVPAGGIFVMLPVLAHHLGFTPEMNTIITSLYILFDAIFTCANILGNGAFALLIADLYVRLKRRH